MAIVSFAKAGTNPAPAPVEQQAPPAPSAPPAPPPRASRKGRPKGSKNKPKVPEAPTAEQVDADAQAAIQADPSSSAGSRPIQWNIPGAPAPTPAPVQEPIPAPAPPSPPPVRPAPPPPTPPAPPAPPVQPAQPAQPAAAQPTVAQWGSTPPPPAMPTEAPPGSQLPATQNNVSDPFTGGENEIEMQDVKFAKLNLVQNVGQYLRSKFEPGTIVLDKETALPFDREHPLRLVVFSIAKKRWVEQVPGGTGRLARSREEVIAMGGALTWKEAQDRKVTWFKTLATIFFLLRCPDDCNLESLFGYEAPDGSLWEIVQGGFKGTLYNAIAVPIFTKVAKRQLTPLWIREWLITETFQQQAGPNLVVSARFSAGNATTPEFQAWVSDLRGLKDPNRSAEEVEAD